MNQEESAKSTGYEASPVEIQNVILEWAQATNEFHRRYARLTDVINSLHMASGRPSAASRTRLRNLILLREYMSDVLMTLLGDMSGQKPGRSALPSKPGQLRSHASLLDELSRQIDAELICVTTVAQA